MSLPKLSSVAGGSSSSSSSSSSKGDPYKEFRCLAEDFRKRQALVHNSKQTNKPSGTCSPQNKDTTTGREHVSSDSQSTGTSALLPPPHGYYTNGPQRDLSADGTVEQQPDCRPGVVPGQADSRLRAATAVYRNRKNTGIKSGGSTPKKKKTRRSSSGRTHSSSSSRRNTTGRRQHHRETAAAAAEEDFDEEYRDGGGGNRLDPRVEAAMVRVFRNDNDRDGCRGVSVSDIRSLYRKRHQREKAAALNEVRRWWKLSSSGMTTAFTEATAAAALLLAPQESGGGEGTILRETRFGLNNDGPESDEISQIGNAAREYRTLGNWDGVETAASFRAAEGGSTIATNATASISGKSSGDHRIMRETRLPAGDNGHKWQYSIFDNLNWRDVLLNDSYRELLVRDMKQALRAGRKVKMRAQENDSLGGGSCRRRDCQLMLRTLYMQSVQCCADPALPRITREPQDSNGAGGYLCMTMEPAARYQKPEPTIVYRGICRDGGDGGLHAVGQSTLPTVEMRTSTWRGRRG